MILREIDFPSCATPPRVAGRLYREIYTAGGYISRRQTSGSWGMVSEPRWGLGEACRPRGRGGPPDLGHPKATAWPARTGFRMCQSLFYPATWGRVAGNHEGMRGPRDCTRSRRLLVMVTRSGVSIRPVRDFGGSVLAHKIRPSPQSRGGRLLGGDVPVAICPVRARESHAALWVGG